MSYFSIKTKEPVVSSKKLQSLRKPLPSLSIGSNDVNRLNINLKYKDDTTDIDTVNFTTETRSQVPNAGQMNFNIDSIEILQLNDTNQYITGSLNVTSSLNVGGSLSVGNKSVLNNVNVLGNLIVDGSANLKSNLRLSGNYINFGATSGDNGIGLKNNSGTLQYKNTSGSWTNFGTGGSGGITNVTSDGNMIEFNNHVNITSKLNIGGTLSVGGDLNVSGNTTYSLKNGTRHLFGLNTKVFNAVELQTLSASDSANNDQFGVSVSLYEDYALIGAKNINSNKGAAYIFKRNDSTWTQQQKLTASDGAEGDQFGVSVSLYEDYALIGALLDDDNGSQSGSAYIFKRNGSIWNQQAKLIASDGASNDEFGNSVCLYEDYALIGAYVDDSNKGSAYIFKKNGSTWNQQQKLTASDGAASDYFGISVSLYKDYALIGARGDDSNNGSSYIFKRNGSTWNQQQKLLASDSVGDEYFGGAVSLYENYALIGSFWGYGTARSGTAYIFKRNGSTWTQQQKITANDAVHGDYFGHSVSLHKDYALIGSYRDNDSRGSGCIFKRNGNTWTQQKKLIDDSGSSSDHLGASVSLFKDYALLGAIKQSVNAGEAHMFNITEDTLLIENRPNDGTTIASFVSGSKVGIGTNNPDYKLHIEDYEPQIALKSTNDSHQEASCRSEILFKDHNNYCLSKITSQHEGSGNDSKGTLLFYTNPNLSHSLGLGMKIDNDQMTHMYGNVNISGSVNIKDSLKIEKSLSVGEKSYLSNVNILGNLSVLGSVNIGGSLNIGNKVYISDGHISAQVKSFVIDHPTIEGKKLRHGCLEGPEHGIYYRDQIECKEDSMRIYIKDYFTALCQDNYSVYLCQFGPYKLCLKEKNMDNFLVESSQKGFKFDYLIIGQRSKIDIVE